MDSQGLFYADSSNGQLIKWGDLINDLAQVSTLDRYCQESDFYSVFKQLISSLLIGQEITLLDADFSDEEITRLIGSAKTSESEVQVDNHILKLSTKEELLRRIENVSETWKITLFTSGTTGLPKRVSHSYDTITRFVRKSGKHNHDVWGFAYNPTHMAGLQVFFQALINGNPIIRLFGLPKDQIMQSIKEFSITHISATPTFYRLLLPNFEKYPTVVRITSGGERFDGQTSNALNDIFPNAKVTNVYASTEAGTLLASEGNEFILKNENRNLFKIEGNELLIHKSLMGSHDAFSEEWYSTGDLVEIISENPLRFKFLSRKNEMINVGGYKVNPLEVEDAIRLLKGIADVRVFPKSNSVLGNIVCCEVVRNIQEIDERYIRNKLKERLQEYKIPRLIQFVDVISLTRTGKIKRS